jgi:hypothetical protein
MGGPRAKRIGGYRETALSVVSHSSSLENQKVVRGFQTPLFKKKKGQTILLEEASLFLVHIFLVNGMNNPNSNLT